MRVCSTRSKTKKRMTRTQETSSTYDGYDFAISNDDTRRTKRNGKKKRFDCIGVAND